MIRAGRRTERAALTRLLEAARKGKSGTLMLRGELDISSRSQLDRALPTTMREALPV